MIPDVAVPATIVGRDRHRERRIRRQISPVTLAAAAVSILSLLPLAFVGWVTVQTGWSTAVAMVFRPRVAELLANTALLVVLVVPICVAVAICLAFLTERSDLPGARILSLLAVAPLAIPAFVQSYAWVTLLPGLHGLSAGVLLSVLAYYPFLYLPIAATLRGLDPALEEAAAAIGDPPLRVYRRVVVPQLRLAILGGSLLIALHLLAEYGLYAMIRFDTFTTAIVEQFQSTFNGPAANMLAGVLVVLCLLLLLLDGVLRGRARYARVGSGAAARPRPVALRRLAPLCLVFPGALLALAVGVPVGQLCRWLFAGGAAVWHLDAITSALGQTMLLAVAGAALATLAAIPMAWIAVRRPGRLQRLLEGSNYIVGSLPGVVIALALVTITVRVAVPLYQTLVTILLAYALMFLPRALVGLRASIAQAPLALEQAAASLGRSPSAAFWSVTLRIAAPGAASSMALVSLGIFNELPATQMLAPNGTRTLAMAFWALSSELDYAAAAPYALVMLLVSLPLTFWLHIQSRRSARR